MSSPDVYEELERMAQSARARADKNTDPRFVWFVDGIEEAQHLVEFLRWRDAREEWPADGCRCILVVEYLGELMVVSSAHGEKHFTASGYPAKREDVARWRYALGPCSCSAVADPAKEG